MNILVDINHPADVHFFKNAICILKNKGHNIIITARDKEVTLQLLKNYKLPHRALSKAQTGLLGLGFELILRQARLLPILLNEKIDLCASVTGACTVPLAKLLGIPSLVFYDTEHATLQNAISVPLATRYLTPACYQKPDTKNQIRYDSVHELAYRHPKYVRPKPKTLDLLGVAPKEKFVIMRFVSWGASHDVGQKGISDQLKRKLIKNLSPYAKIFIVSEAPLKDEFVPYRLNVSPEKVHDILYYAHLFVGEGGTMASECACLGTPAIYVNSLKMGYIQEETKHKLIYDLGNEDDILTKADQIIKTENKDAWKKKSKAFIREKVDTTEFIVQQILDFKKPGAQER